MVPPPPLIFNHPPPPETQNEPVPSRPTAPPGAKWTITYSQQIPNPKKLQKDPPTKRFTGTEPVSATNFLLVAHAITWNGGGHFNATAYTQKNVQGQATSLREGNTVSTGGYLSFVVTLRTAPPAAPPAGPAGPRSGARPPPGAPGFDPTADLDDDDDDDDDDDNGQEPDLDTQARQNAQNNLNHQVVDFIQSQSLTAPPLPTAPAGQAAFDRSVRQILQQHGLQDLPPLTEDSVAFERQLLEDAQAQALGHAAQGSSQHAGPPQQMHAGTSQQMHAGPSQQTHPGQQFGQQQEEEEEEEEPEEEPEGGGGEEGWEGEGGFGHGEGGEEEYPDEGQYEDDDMGQGPDEDEF
ncbi:hypothetical protein AYO22_02487 [Fonsecaea multimorphosa]|nr:hypothetical protein AYO22_02487 [Fonsecaea multimorphosa]